MRKKRNRNSRYSDRDRDRYVPDDLMISNIDDGYFKDYERAKKTYERDQRKEDRHLRSVKNLRHNIIFYDLLTWISFIGYFLLAVFIFAQVWEWYQLL